MDSKMTMRELALHTPGRVVDRDTAACLGALCRTGQRAPRPVPWHRWVSGRQAEWLRRSTGCASGLVAGVRQRVAHVRGDAFQQPAVVEDGHTPAAREAVLDVAFGGAVPGQEGPLRAVLDRRPTDGAAIDAGVFHAPHTEAMV